MRKNKTIYIAPLGLIGITILSGALLLSSNSFATDNTDVVDKINITVPISCSLSGTGMTSHNANIVNGTYQADIGSTTLKAFCNDTNGFAIYAAGYTGNDIGTTNSNKLVGTPASIGNIDTGTATSGNTSNWAMKLATDSNATYAITLDNGFGSYSSVPNSYTKVAHRDSGTDIGTTATGASLTSTYAAFMSQTQPAGTYSGQVIYTLVHPSDHAKPVAHPAILDTGQTVNAKLKSLAATVVNGEETTITPTFDPEDDYDYDYAFDEYIKSIDVHLETPAPAGFIPTEANTISSSASMKPIYIVFDNTNDAGIMHFYTEGEQIFLPSDSSYMFYLLYMLAGLSDISDWDTSNATDMSYMFAGVGSEDDTFALDLSTWNTSSVTDMNSMFIGAGSNATTFALDLSTWNTSSVTDMSKMFQVAGYSAATWSVSGISSWNTSNVTDMSGMFNEAGSGATTFSLDLSSWNTSSVTDMSEMFQVAGYSAATWSVSGISSWNTSSVTDMNRMFSDAGWSASTFTLDLSSWKTSNVTDMSWMFASAGNSATTWSIGDLSSWNTSSVTNMSWMFASAGGSDTTTWSIGNISSWNTSSVEDMSYTFKNAGWSASTFTLDLSSWNTSSVTNMSYMLAYAGYSATTWSIGNISSWNTSSVEDMSGMFDGTGHSVSTFTLDLSSWNTSNVTNMASMFSGAGYSATTWSVIIPQTNGNNINNTTGRIYGQTTSFYGTPPSGKSFTLAQL